MDKSRSVFGTWSLGSRFVEAREPEAQQSRCAAVAPLAWPNLAIAVGTKGHDVLAAMSLGASSLCLCEQSLARARGERLRFKQTPVAA